MISALHDFFGSLGVLVEPYSHCLEAKQYSDRIIRDVWLRIGRSPRIVKARAVGEGNLPLEVFVERGQPSFDPVTLGLGVAVRIAPYRYPPIFAGVKPEENVFSFVVLNEVFIPADSIDAVRNLRFRQ